MVRLNDGKEYFLCKGLLDKYLYCRSLALVVLGSLICIAGNSTLAVAQGTSDHFASLTATFAKHATGVESKGKGTSQLSEFSGYFIHVPASCSGKQRCPLVIALHGERSSGGQEVYKLLSHAEKHGMILLCPDATKPDRWDIIRDLNTIKKTESNSGIKVSDFKSVDIPKIDSAIKIVLQNYSIDTSQIALMGWGAGGSYSLLLGLSNPKIFSRVIISSPPVFFDIPKPENSRMQVYFIAGVKEDSMLTKVFNKKHEVQSSGLLSQIQIALRDDEFSYPEEQTFVFEKLKASWSDSDSSVEYLSRYPILDNEIVEKVIAFQQGFKSGRNSSPGAARWESQVSVPLNIGSEQVDVVITHIPQAARNYKGRRIESYLKQVEVTAQDMMDYRLAIIAARIADNAGGKLTIEPGSSLSRNLEYYRSNKELFDKLDKSGFWTTP